MERTLICNIGKKYINPKDNIDVRTSLTKCFRIGASVQEACDFAGVHISVYYDWEYTFEELSKVKDYLYTNKLSNYEDIDINNIIGSNIDINVELISRLKKNPNFGSDVFTLIEQCRQAQAAVIMHHLEKIHSPSRTKGDWKSSAWFLERTNPERYGRFPSTEDKEIMVEKITVEYVDANKQTTQDRLANLEKEVKESLKTV